LQKDKEMGIRKLREGGKRKEKTNEKKGIGTVTREKLESEEEPASTPRCCLRKGRTPAGGGWGRGQKRG